MIIKISNGRVEVVEVIQGYSQQNKMDVHKGGGYFVQILSVGGTKMIIVRCYSTAVALRH